MRMIQYLWKRLIQKEKKIEDNETKKLIFFTYADDVEAEVRVNVHIGRDKSPQWGEMLIYGNSLNSNSGGKIFYAEDMRKLLWKATKAGKEEIPVEDASYQLPKQSCAVDVTALVDLKEQWLYAFKIVIKTPNSSTTDYFLIP